MSTRDVRGALLAVPVPDELEAQRRAWAVVREAYATREPVPRRDRRLRLLIAVAVLGALVVAALSPPGRSVGGWIYDKVAGEENAEPALFRLPAAGRLLVVSEQGPWIVRPNGSKRLLGSYENASFSPNALYVVVTDGRRVLALEPNGDPRWSLSRPTPVSDARWAPTPGFRVAYREDDELRVVEADSGEELWSADPGAEPEQLVWSSDGGALLVVTTGGRHPVYRQDGRLLRMVETPRSWDILDAAFAPDTRQVAYSAFEAEEDRSAVFLGSERLQSVEGRLEDIVFSPNGKWLLTGWPEADQLLFLRLPGVSRIVAVSDVRREFDPGSVGATTFPGVAEWCCAP
jgi:hypothetical protein